MKQAIVARRDLGMGAGKLAAQVAHAAVRAVDGASESSRRAWRADGAMKVVLAVESETALFEVAERAEVAGLPNAVVRDAGRTEIEPETPTAVAIGPAPDEAIDEITGDLPLY